MTRTTAQLTTGAPINEWYYTFNGCTNLTMGDGFTFSEGWNSITTVGNNFAGNMFEHCSGAAFTMNSVFNLPQGITSVGAYFASYMFYNCSGATFTMSSVFNLPQGISSVGVSFASYMFYDCRGAAFNMNSAFNLPQGLMNAGNSFALNMFCYCRGAAFTMNSVFNLPQGISSVGTYFASYMFYYCSGAAFQVNSVFKFPVLSQTEVNRTGVFSQAFSNMGNNTVQNRTATSIVNGNPVPSSDRSTFLSSPCFTDRAYIHAYWGGGGGLAPGTTHTVTFNGNGGSPAVVERSVPAGGSLGASMPADPARTGCTFQGWNTLVDGKGAAFEPSLLVAANITVYAQWERNTHTVTFNGNNGSPATVARSVPTGESFGANMPANPTRTGYTFTSWNTQANGSGTAFASATAVNGSMTVYAQWTQNSYTVTFNGNGGTVSSGNATRPALHGNFLGTNMPANPTRSGYTFQGWNTQANGSGIAFTSTTAVTVNTTLYAQWTLIPTPSTYTVTVINGTGSGNYAAGATVSITANAPVTGKSFEKWTTPGGVVFENANNQSTIFTMPANDVTVTAGYMPLFAPESTVSIKTLLNTVRVQAGTSFTIPYSVYDGKTEVKTKLTWKSSNPKVKVSNTGKVTIPKSLKTGKATITATAENSNELKVTVYVSSKAKQLKSVKVTAPKKMKVGQTKKVGIKLNPAKATMKSITFKSSNARGLYVDKAGNLIAKKKGNYTITVKANNKTVQKRVAVTK